MRDNHTALADRLRAALGESLPYFTRDGGFIATGYDAALDELRQLATDTKVVLAKLQAAYAARTGIKTLKIQYNQVFGYFVEVSPGTAAALQAEPHSAVFRHKQTLANAVRFTTDELSALESRILNATSEALARELALFDELAGAVLAAEDAIANAAAALAALDCTASLADLAQRRPMCVRMWTTAAASSSRAAGIPPWNRRWRATAARSSATSASSMARASARPASWL